MFPEALDGQSPRAAVPAHMSVDRAQFDVSPPTGTARDVLFRSIDAHS
jgi:hypothetical protein